MRQRPWVLSVDGIEYAFLADDLRMALHGIHSQAAWARGEDFVLPTPDGGLVEIPPPVDSGSVAWFRTDEGRRAGP